MCAHTYMVNRMLCMYCTYMYDILTCTHTYSSGTHERPDELVDIHVVDSRNTLIRSKVSGCFLEVSKITLLLVPTGSSGRSVEA